MKATVKASKENKENEASTGSKAPVLSSRQELSKVEVDKLIDRYAAARRRGGEAGGGAGPARADQVTLRPAK